MAEPTKIKSELENFADPEFLELVSDVILDLDEAGNILQVRPKTGLLGQVSASSWRGKHWRDTVSAESKSKLEDLLLRLNANPPGIIWQDLHQVIDEDMSVLVRFGIIRKQQGQGWIAAGRDMGEIAGLKQQLLNAQMTLEHDYWRLRQLETRYRSLLNMVDRGVMVVDEESGRILEANAAADAILGDGKKKIVGQPFPIGFDRSASTVLKRFLSAIRSAGKDEVDGVPGANNKQRLSLQGKMLRQNEEARLLISVSATEAGEQMSESRHVPKLDSILQSSPDAVLLTDHTGEILAANPTFLRFCQLDAEAQVIGRNIDQWLGRTSVDLGVLLTNLKRHQQVKLFATSLKGQHGSYSEVEISAMEEIREGDSFFVFFIRETSRRIQQGQSQSSRLPGSVAQITGQVGKVPLKGLVRQSTDVIEKLCIDAALELTNNNRASAAELLGLSRQSLYAKLRRYEVNGDSAAPSES